MTANQVHMICFLCRFVWVYRYSYNMIVFVLLAQSWSEDTWAFLRMFSYWPDERLQSLVKDLCLGGCVALCMPLGWDNWDSPFTEPLITAGEQLMPSMVNSCNPFQHPLQHPRPPQPNPARLTCFNRDNLQKFTNGIKTLIMSYYQLLSSCSLC